MKKIHQNIMIIILILFSSSATAFTLLARHQPKCCYYYSGYAFDYSNYDYQVDTACVDICIDKTHTLQRCMRSCSNYTPAFE